MCDKIIYGLLTALILSACGSDRQTSDNKAFTFDTQNTETNGLIGKWTISNTISRTSDTISETLCNACPTINFNTNNAVITFPNSTTENYSWRITSDTLTLLPSTHTPTSSTAPYFINFKYKMIYKQEKDFLELRLSPDRDLTYVLRR